MGDNSWRVCWFREVFNNRFSSSLKYDTSFDESAIFCSVGGMGSLSLRRNDEFWIIWDDVLLMLLSRGWWDWTCGKSSGKTLSSGKSTERWDLLTSIGVCPWNIDENFVPLTSAENSGDSSIVFDRFKGFRCLWSFSKKE